MDKGFLVYTVDVLQMPPHKAEAFCERVADKLKEGKPEGWSFIVLPARMTGNKVQVFKLNDEYKIEEILPFVLQSEKLTQSPILVTPESVKEHARLMLGEPVLKLSERTLSLIDYCTERAFYYNVNNKHDFVITELECYTKFQNKAGEVDFEVDFDEET